LIGYDYLEDLRGLTCPLLLVKMKQSLKQIDSNQTLLVKTSDASSEKDFQAYIDTTPYQMLYEKVSGEWHYYFSMSDLTKTDESVKKQAKVHQ
jgi:tRNA 2-thiouridine synthesizing protein A